jgi:hypothetical protein
MIRSTICAAWVIGLAIGAPVVGSEYSLLPDSTVLGRNFGAPSGWGPAITAAPGQLQAVAETVVFFKNLELTGFPEDKNVDGQTFIGFLAPLRMRYRAHEQVTLELGAVIGHNFGDDDSLDVAEPLLRIIYEPTPAMYLIGGTIYPTHWIHDALLDDVQKLREPAEQGVQWRIDKADLKQDLWLNWRIRETDDRSEHFEVGNATQVRFFDQRLHVDAQLLWSHTGGQRNAEDTVRNNMALSAGGSWGFTWPQAASPLRELRLGAHWLWATDDTDAFANDTGSGVELAAWADLDLGQRHLLRVSGSYYLGDELPTERGDPLYHLGDYAQLGATVVFRLPADLRIEVGAVGQFAEGEFNHTYFVNLAWGGAFDLARPNRP